jgi:hypothetical protein
LFRKLIQKKFFLHVEVEVGHRYQLFAILFCHCLNSNAEMCITIFISWQHGFERCNPIALAIIHHIEEVKNIGFVLTPAIIK